MIMKKGNNNSSDSSNSGEVPKQKERHIVSWSQEEDDILREQIGQHGTENWTIIASKFKDKTTRQCRRRWFTYLNSDFKKGGWSPEEDLLLCEAQKIFGNRWTEIAKVVSGRTDNAVKNRFTTLCKKRAKQEAAAKENNNTPFINLNNKRVVFPSGVLDGGSESAVPYKKLRTYIRENGEGVADNILRPPLAVLAQDVHSSQANFPNEPHVGGAVKETSGKGSAIDKAQGTFLKKDNPKVVALMQQAELLSSLATKINSEKTDQSLESAWMVLQDFLKQNKESDLVSCRDTDLQIENIEKLMEDLKSSTGSSISSLREPGLYELSPASSEYSTGSTHMPNLQNDKKEGLQENELELQSESLKDQNCLIKGDVICHSVSKSKEKDGLTCDATKANDEVLCEHSNGEFSSPLHVTPLFRSMAAAVPTPVFSESEKHFLMKTLGMESSPITKSNPSQTPLCKRSLLHCL